MTLVHATTYSIDPPHSPQNMIGQSQSGTGKTAAFVLTMLSRVDFEKNHPQVRSFSSPVHVSFETMVH